MRPPDMTPESTRVRLQTAAQTYPFPIAFLLRMEYLDAPAPPEQADGLIRIANAALQYAALVVASDYVAAPFTDEQLSHRLERLRRPLVSDFAGFLTTGVPVLHGRGSLFVPELAESVERLRKERGVALRMGEHGLEQYTLPLLDAVLSLRNDLAHDRFRDRWKEFVDLHAPLIAQFLQALGWCASYPLLRRTPAGEWLSLTGAAPSFPLQAIPEAAREAFDRARDEGDAAGLWLADPAGTRLLPLYPFALWADCPYCAETPLPGLVQEALLFNGEQGKLRASYSGVRHPLPLSGVPRERLSRIFAAKEVPPEAIRVSQATLPVVGDRAFRQSEIWVGENVKARRYLPDVYFPRRDMETCLEEFLRGAKAGFLLLGEAGIGKTSLMCRKRNDWRDRGEAVLFYPGHTLSPTGLEERLPRDLHLAGTFDELIGSLRRQGGRLLLIVDGVNEHPDAVTLLRGLCEFIARHGPAEGGGVKVILSLRAAFFSRALRAWPAGGGEADLLPTTLFQTRRVEEQGRKVETYCFELGRVAEEELEALYEGYRACPVDADGEGPRLRPRTPFRDLPAAVRRILTHPWYLRLVMEAYHDKPIPPTLWTGDVLEAFYQEKVFGTDPARQERFRGRRLLVRELVGLMRRRGKAVFALEELHEHSPAWARELPGGEMSRSAYFQLVDEGVLMEVPEQVRNDWGEVETDYHIRFAFDALLEYLLSREVSVDGVTGERCAALLLEGEAFDPLIGAVEVLLAGAAQRGDHALAPALLNAAEPAAAAPVLVRVLLLLERVRGEQLTAALDALAGHGAADRAATVLLQAAAELNARQRFRPALACALRAERLYRANLETGQTGAVNGLARALINQGVAQGGLFSPGEAVRRFEEAVALRRMLVGADERPDRIGGLAAALVNNGNALVQLGLLDEAAARYDEAIVLRRRAADEGSDRANELAGALMNKGVVLDRLGRSADALPCYDGAVSLRRGLVEAAGRGELASDLAAALLNRGVALGRLNRAEEAMASLDEAAAHYRRAAQTEGRGELFNDLAAALVDKGVVLERANRPDEALACFADAVSLRRRLVADEGRNELADDLAAALVRQAQTLARLGQAPQAVACYDEAIRLRQAARGAGMTHQAPALLRSLRGRMELFLALGRIAEAAADLVRALNHAAPFLQLQAPPEAVVEELKELLGAVGRLAPAEREQVVAATAEWGEKVRGWL